MSFSQKPVLFVVATPIGNLEDRSERVVRILRECDLIAAEDSRLARRLLTAIGVSKKEIISYYDQVEQERGEQIIERMEREKLSVALISDAGTPCISDPGYRIVAAAHERGITVSPIPGPSALTALVSASGLPNSRLLFVGFLPTKRSAKLAEMESWRFSRASVVFFESTRRVAKTLELVKQLYPHCRLAIGRELTKIYEEVLRVDVDQALVWAVQPHTQKGEAVIMLDLTDAGEDQLPVDEQDVRKRLWQEAAAAFKMGKSLRDALRELNGRGLDRSSLYNLLLEVKDGIEGEG